MQLFSLWDWYIGLFSNSDDKVKVAAWGATVTTVVAVSTLIIIPLSKYLKKRFEKVTVEAGISYKLVPSSFGITAHAPLLTVTVTNLTEKSIFIKKPTIVINRKINGEDEFQVIAPTNVTFPYKIEHGDQFKESLDSSMLSDNILTHLADTDKIGFKIRTTTDKSYLSNTFTKSHILGHMQVADNLNKKHQ